jgi:hypothetical protein
VKKFPPTISRFDYIKYDDDAVKTQASFKQAMISIEAAIESGIVSPGAKHKAIQHLEECYMWIGKGIRDDQIHRDGFAPLMEERSES